MAKSKLRRLATRATMRTYHQLRLGAEDVGLLPTDEQYTRFICVGNPRTGSTLLMRSLNNHSHIIGYGELTKNSDRYPAPFHQFGHSRGLYRDDPVGFLRTRVFRKYPAEIEAVGFKIFYHHAPRGTQWGSAVWEYLLGDPTLKILHLKRHNLLKTFLSKQTASRSGEYIKYTNGQERPPVHLDPDEMLAFFEKMRAGEAQYDDLLRGHPLIEVRYEDMTRNYAAEMQRIQEFLGVTTENIEQGTTKRPSRPLSSQIANYAELKEACASTPWAEFFTE